MLRKFLNLYQNFVNYRTFKIVALTVSNFLRIFTAKNRGNINLFRI